MTNIRVGAWLFLTSEAMLFASLFFAYAMLRMGAPQWSDGRAWVGYHEMLATLALVAAVPASPRTVWAATGAGAVFLVVEGWRYAQLLHRGLHPAEDVAFATWSVLVGVHSLHVAGGTLANAWCALTLSRIERRHAAERLHALRLYWMFMLLVWIAMLVAVSA